MQKTCCSQYYAEFFKHFIYKNIRLALLGIIKKLKETAEKGVEKGVELGVKGFDKTKDAAKKGYDKAKEEERRSKMSVASGSSKDNGSKAGNDQSSDAIKVLKLRLAKGEITEKEFLRSKKLLEE